MRRLWFWLVELLAAPGCDRVFGLTQLEPPADASPDAPPDVAIDAPTMLDCSSSPILARPDGISMVTWRDQVPTTGTHLDKIAESIADDDASYIATTIDGQLDLFSHVPVAAGVTIDSVTIWVHARIEVTSDLPSLGPALFSGGVLNWDDRFLATSWGDVTSDVYANDPSTGSPWSVAGFNALTFGVRKTYSGDPVRVTQIWASVACH